MIDFGSLGRRLEQVRSRAEAWLAEDQSKNPAARQEVESALEGANQSLEQLAKAPQGVVSGLIEQLEKWEASFLGRDFAASVKARANEEGGGTPAGTSERAKAFTLDQVDSGPAVAEKTEPPLIQGWEKNFATSLKKANFFFEADSNGSNASSADFQKLALVSYQVRTQAQPGFFTGLDLRVKVAGFVGRDKRTDGDFRHAYGEAAFRSYMRTHAKLFEIPRGHLHHALSVDWVKQLHRLMVMKGSEQFQHHPRVDYLMDSLLRQGSSEAGQFRTDSASLRIEQLTGEGAQTLDAQKLKVTASHSGAIKAELVKPQDIEAELHSLLSETKAALVETDADVFEIAAKFMQRFVAIRPFKEGSERLGRLLMYRLLDERGVLQPVLSEFDNELSLSQANYVKKLKEGVSRTMRLYGLHVWSASPSYRDSMPSTMLFMTRSQARMGYKAPVLPSGQPLSIDGIRFAQGRDGFLYDEGGRAYTFTQEGHLAPLPTMNLYFLARRISELRVPQASEWMNSVTQADREQFASLCQNPEKAKEIKVLSDREAMAADARFEMVLPSSGNDAFLRCFDPQGWGTDDATRDGFWASGIDRAGSEYAFTLSRYTQTDLEYWHVEKALERSGDHQGLEQIRRYRAELFALAKRQVEKLEANRVDALGKSTPKMSYEQTMWEASPLRFPSFEAYLASGEDEHLTVWHGAQGLAAYMGVHPDNNPKGADARQVAEQRAQMGGVGNFHAEFDARLSKFQGSAVICTTSDLGLLSQPEGFADKTHKQDIPYNRLPPAVSAIIKSRLKDVQEIRIDSADDLLAAALGVLPPTPKGHLNLKGIPDEVIDNLVASRMDDARRETFYTRLKEAREAPVDNKLRGWLQNVFDEKPVLVKVDDLMQDHVLSEVSRQVAKGRDSVLIQAADSRPDEQFRVILLRAAFPIRVNKADCLPSYGMPEKRFSREQEIHLLKRAWPNTMGERMTQRQMVSPLPSDAPSPIPD